MSIVLRWTGTDHLAVWVGPELAVSVSNTDDVPGSVDEPTAGPASVAAYTTRQLARVLGIEIFTEGNEQ